MQSTKDRNVKHWLIIADSIMGGHVYLKTTKLKYDWNFKDVCQAYIILPVPAVPKYPYFFVIAEQEHRWAVTNANAQLSWSYSCWS